MKTSEFGHACSVQKGMSTDQHQNQYFPPNPIFPILESPSHELHMHFQRIIRKSVLAKPAVGSHTRQPVVPADQRARLRKTSTHCDPEICPERSMTKGHTHTSYRAQTPAAASTSGRAGWQSALNTRDTESCAFHGTIGHNPRSCTAYSARSVSPRARRRFRGTLGTFMRLRRRRIKPADFFC